MLPLLYTGGGRVEAVSRDWFQFPACLFSISPQLVHASSASPCQLAVDLTEPSASWEQPEHT